MIGVRTNLELIALKPSTLGRFGKRYISDGKGLFAGT
jgi:hypothetical protein